VHDGSATMDWMDQERERGITITSAATTCFWTPTTASNREKGNKDEYRINLIDTPGHIDFTVEVKRSLRVLDGAVVVFDGVAGVEPQSETNWRYADEYKVPRICFINKLDRMGASFEKSFASIKDRLTADAVAIHWPIGSESNFEGVVDLLEMKAYGFEGAMGETLVDIAIPANLDEIVREKRKEMIEKIVEQDEDLMTKYLASEEIPVQDLKKALRKGVLAVEIIPVLTGSALKNKGVQLVLDAVVDYLPSPKDLPPVKGMDPNTESEITRALSDEEPFSALAFKIAVDPFVGSLSFFRVYSGVLKRGSYIYNSTKGEKERVGRILRMHANDREEVEEVYSGDIAALVGMKSTTTGDTLCEEETPIILEKIIFPEPVISARIEPKTKADQEKMGVALKRLSDEDPTFKVSGNAETGETIIAGMGELHLEVFVERMKREFKVEANLGRPQVSYKETITAEATAEEKYIKQSGGRGQYGHVVLKVEPMDSAGGYEFVNQIKGGSIPNEYIPAVEKGIKESLTRGIRAGYKVVDFKVTLMDGSYHEVDSSEAAFKIAGSMAFQKACKVANPIILEPVMKVQIIVPTNYLGDITGDVSARRGKIDGMEDRLMVTVVNTFIPLSEMFGYATNLRSMTQGRGNFTMEFSSYEKVPESITQEIIQGKKQ
ncbi:MAG: elongation factor G, partial [Candidatus Harrisonbacteria bacterium CG10_big_fil_rev_8_21_14_0_10_38_8]